jgi:hypothetical protein
MTNTYTEAEKKAFDKIQKGETGTGVKLSDIMASLDNTPETKRK